MDIAAGTAVRFEPGDTKPVTLCSIGGHKLISGGNGLATGLVEPARVENVIRNLLQRGFAHTPEPGALEINEDTDMGREAYISMFGPTVGDRVRLGDTSLWVVVERDTVRRPLLLTLPDALLMLYRPYTATKSSLEEVRSRVVLSASSLTVPQANRFVKAWAKLRTGLLPRSWTLSSQML